MKCRSKFKNGFGPGGCVLSPQCATCGLVIQSGQQPHCQIRRLKYLVKPDPRFSEVDRELWEDRKRRSWIHYRIIDGAPVHSRLLLPLSDSMEHVQLLRQKWQGKIKNP